MKKNIIFFGWFGLLASIMDGAGDFLVLFNPNGFNNEMAFGYFLGIGLSRFTIGQYLAPAAMNVAHFGLFSFSFCIK